MSTQPMYCTARFLRPFLAVLAKQAGLTDGLELARAVPLQARIGMASFHELVTSWVRETRDIDLGLRAGRATCLGSGGALDYALHTAPSLRESLALVQRYAWLYSDALEFAVVGQRDGVSIRISTPLSAPRAVTDFILSWWYRNHLQPYLDGGMEAVCCFSYPAPLSVGVHRDVFGPTKLVFNASFDGFLFESRVLDHVLESADTSLHDVHCGALPRSGRLGVRQEPWTMRVRRVLAAELHQGRPRSGAVARLLGTSRRTLLRRLKFEGTTFTLVLDDLRRQRSLDLVQEGVLPLYSIAKSLGFAHVQAFHRYFKRWTGMTPRAYRATNPRGPAAKETTLSTPAAAARS